MTTMTARELRTGMTVTHDGRPFPVHAYARHRDGTVVLSDGTGDTVVLHVDDQVDVLAVSGLTVEVPADV